MDTSKEYIEMCEKAVEVQRLKYKEDFGPNIASQWKFDIGKTVWLPRQDQLQEMVKDKLCRRNSTSYCLVKHGYDVWFARNVGALLDSFIDSLDWNPASMEQLWLAFVMKEEHGKTWNGENWVQ